MKQIHCKRPLKVVFLMLATAISNPAFSQAGSSISLARAYEAVVRNYPLLENRNGKEIWELTWINRLVIPLIL